MSQLPYLKGVDYLHQCRRSGDLNPCGNASVVFQRKNGSVLRGSGQACHGCMSHPPCSSSGVEFIISGIQSKSGCLYSDEEGKFYLNWLMNDSMYARCFVTKDADWCFTYEAIVVRPDIEANFLLSALQNTRRLWEFTYIPKMFYEFMQAGVNPELSHFLAHNCAYKKEDRAANFNRTGSDHYPINSAHMGKEDLLRWLKREPKPKSLNDLWSNNPGYRGVQAMFYDGRSDTSVFNKYLEGFEIVDKVKTRSINPFAKAKPKTSELKKYYEVKRFAKEVKEVLEPKILKGVGYAKDSGS